MNTVSDQERHETILRLLRIANISRDLDRSRDDGQFATEEGEIVYVLDENIFEMFVKPFEYSRNVETFYAQEWGSRRIDSIVRRRYEAQSALIASEHLVVGDLPGNADDTLYMTEPHRWELFSRLSELTDEMRDSLDSREEMLSNLQAKLLALHGLADQKPAATGLDSHLNVTLAEDLEADIRAIRSRRDVPAALNRIRATRVATEILANNNLAEPLDQLRRLTSHAVRGRVRDLQDKIECPPQARRAIDTNAKFWLGELQKELQLPSNRKRKRALDQALSKGGSSKGALNNDALSIAYLRWAAKALAARGERLVFVTGDDIVFDTYRRWYSDPNTDVRAEPFFMRRATQFSPIFIPFDSGGDLSKEEYLANGRHTIFDRVQEAIESTLIPIVLAEQSEHPEKPIDGVYPKSRERLALKLEAMRSRPGDPDLAAFASKLDTEFLTAQRESLRVIRDLWQSAQRLIIGASFDLLAARMTAEQRELMANVRDPTDEQAAAVLSEYANKVLISIVEESVQLWFPLAKEFLAGRGRDVGATTPSYRRLWPALNLRRQFPRLDFDKTPELVFAEAAASAIAIQDPSNACRFARLALRAEAANGGDSTDGLREELRYLAAVSCRLLICTIDLSAKHGQSTPDEVAAFQRGLAQIKDLYAEASGHIHSLAAYHDAAAEEGPDDARPAHQVRYLRALSERASINLFMATALGLSRSGSSIEREGVGRYLELSRGDLRLCALRDKSTPGDALLAELLTAVRAQYAPNVAGYEVLSYVLDTNESYRPQQWPKIVYGRLRAFADTQPKPHPLLRAELVGFYMILGTSPRKLTASDFVDGMEKLRLSLDKSLYRRIFSDIFEVDTGKAMGMSR